MRLTATERVFRALAEAEVRYLVVGGLAVVAHGHLRFTRDLDLFVQLVPDNVTRALVALGALGYRPHQPVTVDGFADPVQRRRWAEEKGMKVLNLFSDQYPDTPVDIFVEAPLDFDEELPRALVKELAPGLPVPFVSRASLIQLKKEAGRPQDLVDVDQLELLAEDS